LKVKIEVGEEFPVGQFGFFDPPFGPPLRPGIVFQAEQALEKFGNRGGLGGARPSSSSRTAAIRCSPSSRKSCWRCLLMVVLRFG
jgi:hypothetical protein